MNDDVKTRYIQDDNMSHDGPADGDTSVFMHGVKPISKIRVVNIDDKAKINKLAWYVLNNCNEVGPYVEKYDFYMLICYFLYYV